MSTRCVDVAFYWTPQEAGAIVDYLDHLRDTVWDLYSDDIIGHRTRELDEQVDHQQEHSRVNDYKPKISPPSKRCELLEDDTFAREALPSLDDLPSLSDENVDDMLNLLRKLLGACEEHYKDPIRRMEEQRQQELLHRRAADMTRSPLSHKDDDS